VRAAFAMAYGRPPSGSDPEAYPWPEASLRRGVHERADVGLKLAPFHVELNALVAVARGERTVLSVMPGLGFAWLWERPGSGLGHGGDRGMLGGFAEATRVTSFKLPVLVGWRGPRDRVGILLGPTIHGGFRGCRDRVRTAPDEQPGEPLRYVRVHTCAAADRGGFVGVGAHFGLQAALGTFVKLMPEFALLALPVAPRAREVAIDHVRDNFSRGDLLLQLGFAVQLGRFVRMSAM
jgi:hypothetical protein